MTAIISPDQFLDPIWRINNLYTCLSKPGRNGAKAVPFRLWDEQLEFLQNIHSRNDILKCRQRGMTTLMAIVQLDDCVFNKDVRAAIIAHRMDDAKVIFRDKVKFPYDNLDEALRERVPSVQDSADTLSLKNGSSFRVSNSVRSSTLDWLHVSEYGKICAQFPDKAREIRTGSFPAAEMGVITVESTAEGESGHFYEISQEAQRLLDTGAKLGRKDFRFFFFPWWRAREYRLKFTNIPVSPDDEAYFERLANEIRAIPFLSKHFDGFNQEQKNWWVTTEAEIGGDMKREYPGTPKESFEQALEGAIFTNDLASAYKHHRIDSFPFDPTKQVHTFWDLGFSTDNETAIWFGQDHGGQMRMIHYYENSGEHIEHYVRYMNEWAAEHNAVFGKHYLPHDGDRSGGLWHKDGTLKVMKDLGFTPRIVTRITDKVEAVRMAHRKFPTIAFDEAGCKEGIARLKQYRKEWDDRRGIWRENPFHGPESNGVDALLTFVQSGHTPSNGPIKANDRYRRDRDDDSSGSWMTA